MISLAAHLKRQSPSMSYGNGWIMGENGKRWHPVLSQQVKTKEQRGTTWLSRAIQCWPNLLPVRGFQR
ncbi:phage filamentation protein Fil family protein [uncultured Pantoea sp.]|uniref:phage filamentation protein Fil family protein n=1 Tax=uncultured Pantoea sp. TaxID=218084 RepID=UPI0027D93E36|nr:phage filamentation protein Fil family protein [uncultured Pantoea sp.]